MSATNRGTKRVESDFYPTPIKNIKTFVENYRFKDGAILEPCAGNGNFIKALRECGFKSKLIANEIRKEEHDNLIEAGADIITHNNFLEETIIHKDVKTIITNPPFTYAKEFIIKCKELYPEAEIIMLLRLAFLESKKRYDFWRHNPVSKLYILSQRPSFIGKGTDATAYAWFVWNNENQEIKII